MLRKPIFLSCAAFAVLLVACGSSDEDGNEEEQGQDAAAQPTGDAGVDQPSNGEDGGGGAVDATAPRPETCGDGVVDADKGEECDDGDDDNDDGCTNLCAFSCDDDSDCDDQEICDGAETCDLDKHACVPSTENAPDGTACGDNASCYEGRCEEHICNNGILQPGEECDDGDDRDDNGCTRECLYTCHVGEEFTIVNDCAPNSTCDETTHMWVGGDPLPDGTICGNGDGYCLNGVCTLSDCGDGEVEPNEECDLGEEKNGVEGSGCSAACTTSVCGNGEIEGNEGCDDGNDVNLDGCDRKCRPEVTYRGTALQIAMDDAPSYCVHAENENSGNLFGDLFPNEILLDVINVFLQDAFQNGEAHTLFQVMDVEDFSSTEPDPLARLGLSMGQPLVEEWVAGDDHLDFEFNAYTEYFDDDLQPLNTVSGELVIENDRPVVQSTAPATAGFIIGGMNFVLHDMMARIETDGNLSTLTEPPTYASHVQAPETVGSHGSDTPPTGVLCGALHEEVFASLPLPAELLVVCLDQLAAGTYTPCEEGQSPQEGECDSVLTLFQGGCTDLGLPFLNPLGEGDVDTDGDGETDAYTAVLYVSAERVKIVGVMDRPPPPEEE